MNTPADHEAYLRAALHAAADSLEPRGDGLERIRARLARPRAIAWVLAAGDALRLRAPAALQDGFYRLSGGFWSAWERFAPAPAPGKHRSRTQGLLRPLAAMAAVIFIVAAGTYVAIDASTAVAPSSQSSHPRSGKPGGGGQPAASPSQSPSHVASGSAPIAHHASATPSCTPSATPAPSDSGTESPSPNPSVSPTPTSPSATPSDTTDVSDSGTSLRHPKTRGEVVTAVRLTAFTTVESRAAAKVARDSCSPSPTASVTPQPSTTS
jgi:hypothetical protein